MNKTSLVWPSLVAAALLFSGCSSTAKKDEGGQGAQGGGAVVEERGTGGEDASTSGARAGGSWERSQLDNPDSLLYSKIVYFDFDRSEIRPEFTDMLRAHASFLIVNPDMTVTIEGHCDERGSREYNIGLGERRAQSVQQFLRAEGVGGGQINTISYGEERPAALGHDESAWSQNRRGVLVY